MTGNTYASFSLGEYELVVARDPAGTLSARQRRAWLPGLVLMARSAFGTAGIPERDVALHALQVEFGVYVLVNREPVAFASCAHVNLGDVGVGYLQGVAVAPRARGLGLYPLLIGLRFLSMTQAGKTFEYIAARTQSPVVCQRLIHLKPYPFFKIDDIQLRTVARRTAEVSYTHFSDYRRPAGPSFDDATGVCREAYAGNMYRAVPWSGHRLVDQVMRERIDFGRGDAFMVVSEYTPSIAHGLLEEGLSSLRASETERSAVRRWATVASAVPPQETALAAIPVS